MQIFRFSTARIKINHISCHFSNHESVFTYVFHQLSVSWHIIPPKFSSWNILRTKRAHQITNFQIFECFNEISPNSSCQFWNHNVKVYSNFELLFSVTKDNSTVLFYLNPLYLRKKEPIKVKFSDFWVLGWKITKFLMSKLKLQVLFLFFTLQWCKDFWLLTFLTFDCFCWKYIEIFAERYRLVMSHCSEDWCKIWRKTDLLFQVMTKIWWILTWALKSLKNLHFHWFLLCKVFNVWPKKVQRSYLSWHWRVMQNLKKNWFVVWKMTWGIWKIFTRALESVKIGTLIISFNPK